MLHMKPLRHFVLFEGAELDTCWFWACKFVRSWKGNLRKYALCLVQCANRICRKFKAVRAPLYVVPLYSNAEKRIKHIVVLIHQAKQDITWVRSSQVQGRLRKKDERAEVVIRRWESECNKILFILGHAGRWKVKGNRRTWVKITDSWPLEIGSDLEDIFDKRRSLLLFWLCHATKHAIWSYMVGGRQVRSHQRRRVNPCGRGF